MSSSKPDDGNGGFGRQQTVQCAPTTPGATITLVLTPMFNPNEKGLERVIKFKTGTNDKASNRVRIGRYVRPKDPADKHMEPSTENLIFDSKVMSRQHAEVWAEGSSIYIMDIGSSNGTFRNNERLSACGSKSSPVEILTGDLLQLGVDVTESNTNISSQKHKCVMLTALVQGGVVNENSGLVANDSQVYKMLQDEREKHRTELKLLNERIIEGALEEQQLNIQLLQLKEIITVLEQELGDNINLQLDQNRLISMLDMMKRQLEFYQMDNEDEGVKAQLLRMEGERFREEQEYKEKIKQLTIAKHEAIQAFKSLQIDTRKMSQVHNAEVKFKTDALKNEREDLIAQLKATQDELIDVRAECDTMKNELSLEQENNNIHNELETLKKLHEEKIREMEELSELSREELKSSTDKLKTTMDKAIFLQEQNEKIQQDVHFLGETKEKLEVKIVDFNTTIEKLNVENATLEETKTTLIKKIDALNEEMENSKKSQAENDKAIVMAERDLKAAEKDTTIAIDEKIVAEEMAKAAKEEAKAAKEEAKAAKEEAKAAKEESKASKEEAKASKEEAKASKEEAKASKEEAKASKEEAKASKEEAKASKEEAKASKEEAKIAIEKLGIVKEESTILHSKVKELEDKLAVAIKTTKSLETSHEATAKQKTADLADIKKVKNNLEQELMTTKHELMKANDSLNSKEKEVERFSERIEELTIVQGKLNKSKHVLKKAEIDLKEAMANLKNQGDDNDQLQIEFDGVTIIANLIFELTN
eukprot:UC4_evm2s638